MHKDAHFQGMYDPFPQVEYEAFIFKNDIMHDSLNGESFQFESNSYKHSDQNFHDVQVVESESKFYMHCGSQGLDLVLLSGEIQDIYLIGEIDMSEIPSLSYAILDENHVDDRGKQFC